MTTPWERCQQRLTDLLSDRAVFGLNAEETVELRELLPDGRDDDFDPMDQTAAMYFLAVGIDTMAPLPLLLRDRINADAKSVMGCEPQ
jgi:hypothetical protein